MNAKRSVQAVQGDQEVDSRQEEVQEVDLELEKVIKFRQFPNHTDLDGNGTYGPIQKPVLNETLVKVQRHER